MFFYIATDIEIPLLPFNGESPAFNVELEDLIQGNEAFQRLFSKRHIHYIGSDQGCGCGFPCDGVTLDYIEEAEEVIEILESERKNKDDLCSYLREHCSREDSVEIYGFWDGDEEREPNHRFTLSIRDLEFERFYFMQRCLYTVKMGEEETPQDVA